MRVNTRGEGTTHMIALRRKLLQRVVQSLQLGILHLDVHKQWRDTTSTQWLPHLLTDAVSDSVSLTAQSSSSTRNPGDLFSWERYFHLRYSNPPPMTPSGVHDRHCFIFSSSHLVSFPFRPTSRNGTERAAFLAADNCCIAAACLASVLCEFKPSHRSGCIDLVLIDGEEYSPQATVALVERSLQALKS